MLNNKSQDKMFVDGAIRAKTVLVIDGLTGDNLGIMPIFRAIQEAQERGLNLVQMPGGAGGYPTCKIIDYGKLKYDESKKAKAQLKKQRESQIEEKELVIKPNIAINDLKIKAKKAIEFLEDGCQVRITLKCKGREATRVNVINNTLNTFVNLVPGTSIMPLGGSDFGSFCFSYQLVKNSDTAKAL